MTQTPIDSNDLDRLLEQQELLSKHISTLLAAKKTQAIEECKTLIRTFSIDAHELFSTSAPKNTHAVTKKIAPKYKNPTTGETWSGRGLKPRWIVGDKATYLIGV